MKLDIEAFQETDRHLPQPTPAGARLDLSLYFREDAEGQKASIVLGDAGGKEIVDLFMDRRKGSPLSMGRLHYEGFRLARGLRKQRVGWRTGRFAAPSAQT